MANISVDKYLQDVLSSGLVTGAAILSTAYYAMQLATPSFPKLENPEPLPPPKVRDLIIAQKNISLKLPETQKLIECTMKNTIHKDYVTVGPHQYLITTVLDKSFYGRNLDTNPGGGLVICKSARYSSPVLPQEVIPVVERVARSLPQ